MLFDALHSGTLGYGIYATPHMQQHWCTQAQALGSEAYWYSHGGLSLQNGCTPKAAEQSLLSERK
jgi:hypothetical protein